MTAIIPMMKESLLRMHQAACQNDLEGVRQEDKLQRSLLEKIESTPQDDPEGARAQWMECLQLHAQTRQEIRRFREMLSMKVLQSKGQRHTLDYQRVQAHGMR